MLLLINKFLTIIQLDSFHMSALHYDLEVYSSLDYTTDDKPNLHRELDLSELLMF